MLLPSFALTSFKITNIAILENKDKGELFVSMPRYRSNERDESNGVIYKDVCNPNTAEFREELYTNILDAYARIKEPEKEETQKQDRTQEMPEFSVTVTPYERKGSNIIGLARIYFENSFIVNNINIVQGKEKIFVLLFIGIAMMFLGTLPRLFVALILCFLIFRDNLIIEFFPEILCDRIADILIDWLALLIHLLCLIRRHCQKQRSDLIPDVSR